MDALSDARANVRSGDLFYDELDYLQALASYDQALSLIESDVSPSALELTARALRSSGAACFNLNRDADAVRRLQLSWRAYDTLGDEIAAANVDLKLTQSLGAVGQHEAAITHGLRALKVFERHSEEQRVSQLHLWVGRNALSLGRLDFARSHVARGLETSPGPTTRAGLLAVSADLCQLEGDVLGEISLLVQVLELMADTDDHRMTHLRATQLGAAQFKAGMASDARRSFEGARDAALRLGDVERQARSWWDIGLVLEDLGDLSAAADAFEEVAQLSQGPGQEERLTRVSKARDRARAHSAALMPEPEAIPIANRPAFAAPAPSPGLSSSTHAKPRTNGESAVPSDRVAELLDELESLTGLAPVKDQVKALIARSALNARRQELGISASRVTEHLVFTGPPGTGKTTVARLLGRLYFSLGALPTDTFVEVDRAGLVGEYLGHTAVKTNECVDSALGGILFIDEAYSLNQRGLAGGDSFGSEAVSTLVKRMEDSRDELVVIVAGYKQPMTEFLRSNDGLTSRFTTTVSFPSYSALELVEITHRHVAKQSDYLSHEAELELKGFFRDVVARGAIDELGNARLARNLAAKCAQQRDTRLFTRSVEASFEELTLIDEVDAQQAVRGIRRELGWID